jgi:hypothetical protein
LEKNLSVSSKIKSRSNSRQRATTSTKTEEGDQVPPLFISLTHEARGFLRFFSHYLGCWWAGGDFPYNVLKLLLYTIKRFRKGNALQHDTTRVLIPKLGEMYTMDNAKLT